LLTIDFQNIVDSITLKKLNVFNTKMLNNEDIKELLNHQQMTVTITDLMYISVFKIVLHTEFLVGIRIL